MKQSEIINALIRDINSAFMNVPHPGAPESIYYYPCCPDHDAEAEWYSLHTWEDLVRDLEILDYEPSSWYLFNPKGYHYFLQGALVFIVQNAHCDPAGDCWGKRVWRPLDWMRSAIVPEWFPKSENSARMHEEFCSRYLSLFTIDQKNVVIQVLNYLCAFASIPEDDKAETISDVRTAIKEIWSIES